MGQDNKLESCESFLRAITSSPDDLSLRLIYADWLEEHGDENDRARARFIRMEVELTELDENSSRHEELSDQTWNLWQAHNELWTADLIKVVDEVDETRAGFPYAVTTTASQFLRNHELIFELAPIQSLLVLKARRHLPALSQCPGLEQLRILQFYQDDGEPFSVTYAGARRLAESPFVANLEELKLDWQNLGPAGAIALAESPNLGNLKRLDLSANFIGDRGAIALASAPFCPQLTHLDLFQNDIAPDGGLQALVQADLSQLVSLNLSRNPLFSEGVDCLRAASWPQLRELQLSWSDIPADAMKDFAQCEFLPNLRVLYLSGNDLGESGLEQLLNAPSLDNLEELWLMAIGVDKDRVRARVEERGLPKLRDLQLA